MVECRTKSGKLKWRDSLQDFFSPLGAQTLNTATFDPKVVYDHFADRFVVVTLEQTELFFGEPADASRILLAVSKSGNPKTATEKDWNYYAIDSNVPIFNSFVGGDIGYWADYPGFEVDEEAIYITANMFSFVTFVPDLGGFFRFYGGVRLWIVPKAGFYDGSAPSFGLYDPYENGGLTATTMPAQVFLKGDDDDDDWDDDDWEDDDGDDDDEKRSTFGTYLVSYSGITFGGPGGEEVLQVISVDDPLAKNGGPFFQQEFVSIGDVEDIGGIFGFPALPDAPQLGTDALIEVNDRRALDAVVRDGKLWLVATINPNSGPDAGETTAHWFALDVTGGPGTILTLDQGDIGGEDIAPGTFTSFPSVAVNRNGEAAFGFSASAPSIYAGAYVTGRQPRDAAGEVQTSLTVKEGEDYYFRPFSGTRNRWGDYSGIAVDPSNDKFFWVFNEFADERGTVIFGQDGQWGTAYARFRFKKSGFDKALAFTSDITPDELALAQNFPNPFNPQTDIQFQIPESHRVTIAVYNIQGKQVRVLTDKNYEAGIHSVSWDGKNSQGLQLSTGTYFYHMRAGDFTQIKKMTLIK
jgi:hypothetical protein